MRSSSTMLQVLAMPMWLAWCQPGPAQNNPAPHVEVDTPHPKGVDRQFEVHRPDTRLPPRATFEHLVAGYERCQMQRNNAALPVEQRRAIPAPRVRPAGAGEVLTIVLTCADSQLDPVEILGQRRSDVLVLSTPGPTLDSAAIAAMERAATDQRASLLVILGHEACAARTTQPSTPAQEVLARRVGLPSAGRGRSLTEHLDWLAQQVFSASECLRQLQQRDRFQIVTGQVDRRSMAITWVDNPTTQARPQADTELQAKPSQAAPSPEPAAPSRPRH